MYLVTTKWRTALHVGPMRLFTTFEETKKYARSLARLGSGGRPCVWELKPDTNESPRVIRDWWKD